MTRPFSQSAAVLAGALLMLCIAAAGAPGVAGAEASDDGKTIINLNTASAEELQLLPGVGEARARAILEAREAQGGFQRVDDLLAVKGIGPGNLERIRPHASTEGPTRIGEVTP